MSWWERQLKGFFQGGINVSSPADGDFLAFDSSSVEWKNVGNTSSGLLAWQSWTPSYTASGSMTFTATSGQSARYAQLGKVVFIQFKVFGTTGGTANTDIYVSLPVAPAIDTQAFSAIIRDAGSGSTIVGKGLFRTSTSRLQFNREDDANWSLGTNRFISGFGFYEAA